MEQKIIYRGETRALSDLDCPDGDLSLSLNMISENNALRPIVLPDPLFFMNEGEALVYIHSTSNYKNYIYQIGDTLQAFTLNSDDARIPVEFNYPLTGELKQIQAIGNTLIIIESIRMQYVLFKKDSYKILGTKPPELNISFGLTGDVVRQGEFYIETNNVKGKDINAILELFATTGFSDENKKIIFNEISPKINKFIAEEVRDKNRFIYPFFVRYAYRMYDGSLIMHSAPVLMAPTNSVAPRVRITNTNKDNGELLERDEVKGFDAQVWAVVCDLDYYIESVSLEGWKDIVASVEFYISAPIYTYVQDATEVEKIIFVKQPSGRNYPVLKDAYSYCKLNNPPSPAPSIRYNSYTRYEAYEAYALWYWKMNNDGTFTVTESFADFEFVLPNTLDQLGDKISRESLFYKIASIKVEEIDFNTRKKIKLEENVLNTLQVKETMTDDYDSHDSLIPSYAYVYNSRLNICNLKKELFGGFVVSAMCQYQERAKYVYTGYVDSPDKYDMYAYVRGDMGEDRIVLAGSTDIKLSQNPFWLYYPNAAAYKMVIRKYQGGVATVNLKPHTLLNGAYYYGNFAALDFDSGTPVPSADSEISLPNKIYTSQVNNPFLFPLAGINTVGVGQILGISSTTRALSQGQFGQFPLLVFSTDGIWAMEVSNTGLYATKQPMSRDVCSNPYSITQTDGAVVFISAKGAMMISGSEVVSLSNVLDGPSFNPDLVNGLSRIAAKEGLTGELNATLTTKEFFADCRIAFDYTNSRLFFIHQNTDNPYSMVYSILSGVWAKVSSDFVYIINNYPDCYIQDENGGVLNISEKTNLDSTKVSNGFVLSRPLKLGDNELKTVTEIINRGIFEKTDISMVLFASVDGIMYFPIGSAIGPKLYRLAGSPYRYFRIGLVAKLNLQKSISGTSVYFEQRARNKPR
jgi:hypothetical protein